jgi:hypothetical protein
MSNQALIAAGTHEVTGPAIECGTCEGSGLVADTQALSIGRGIRAINRRCRVCEGDGEIFPLQPVPAYLRPQEISEVPNWMVS